MTIQSVRLHENSGNHWVRIGDVHLHPETCEETYLNSFFRVHESGNETTPQLLEGRYLPGLEVGPRAHEFDEIVYVVEGEMIVDGCTLGPGSSLFAAANTPYGFTVGQQGLRFVNFRPVATSREGAKLEGQLQTAAALRR